MVGEGRRSPWKTNTSQVVRHQHARDKQGEGAARAVVPMGEQ